MGDAVEGHEVVLAGRVERDVANDDELVVVNVKGRREELGRVLVQAGEDLAVGAGHAGRGFAQPLAAGTPFTVTVAYKGSPGPMRGLDGDAGWEELTDGVIVASQPHGSPTWFPCNDRAADKAVYRFAVTTDAEYHVVANGTLLRRRHTGRRATWTYECTAPMSPYLATLQIGPYQTRQIQAKPTDEASTNHCTRLLVICMEPTRKVMRAPTTARFPARRLQERRA